MLPKGTAGTRHNIWLVLGVPSTGQGRPPRVMEMAEALVPGGRPAPPRLRASGRPPARLPTLPLREAIATGEYAKLHACRGWKVAAAGVQRRRAVFSGQAGQ